MKLDMGMNIDESNTGEEVRALEQRLQHMRALQTQSRQASQRELAAQKEADTRAQELMMRDPRGHIQMMKMEQEHMQLVLELPRTLLQSQAQVYFELQNAQEAFLARMPDSGRMMGRMVAMASWVADPDPSSGAVADRKPFHPSAIAVHFMWSDVTGGILVMALAAIAFRSGHVWPAWANIFVGLWLAFAPLLFWTRSPAAFKNDMLVGTLVIAFAILIPMMMQIPTEMPGPKCHSGGRTTRRAGCSAPPCLPSPFSVSSLRVTWLRSNWDTSHGLGIPCSVTARSSFSLRKSRRPFLSSTQVWAPSFT
jgi:hypothetical protein